MKIEVRNAPSELCRKVFTAAAGELRRFRPNQFYTDSTDAIAQLHGYVNFEEFKRGHDFRRAAIKEFLAQGAKGNDRLALLQALIDSRS
ncbi:MAG: hypothetical protein KKD13_03920, partial [Candidatus Margulisbacteria bacterium]|nr:hypothetical protein [Candidatus Margulisiibacteriota bacterium]